MTTKENKIFPCTPFKLDKKLGLAIKEFVRLMPDDSWIIIMDHDILLVQYRWYELCNNAINQLDGEKVGWITGVTNKIGCPAQKAWKFLTDFPKFDHVEDMDTHYGIADMLYNENQQRIVEHKEPKQKFSGLFILTPVSVIKQFLSFPDDKFIGFDNWYYDRLLENEYKTFIIPSLYLYHSYRRLWKNVT